MKYKKTGYRITGYGVNIYTGRKWYFEESSPLSLRRLQSAISYKRDQGFCGTVHVRYILERESESGLTYQHFRIYDVPFRGIGRITFEDWR